MILMSVVHYQIFVHDLIITCHNSSILYNLSARFLQSLQSETIAMVALRIDSIAGLLKPSIPTASTNFDVTGSGTKEVMLLAADHNI